MSDGKIDILDGWMPDKKIKVVENFMMKTTNEFKGAISSGDINKCNKILKENGKSGNNFLVKNFNVFLDNMEELLFTQYSFNEKLLKKIIDELCTKDYQISNLMIKTLYVKAENRKNILKYGLGKIKNDSIFYDYLDEVLDVGREDDILMDEISDKFLNYHNEKLFFRAMHIKSKKTIKFFIEKYPDKLKDNLFLYLTKESDWENDNDYKKLEFLNECYKISEFKNTLDRLFKKGIDIDYLDEDGVWEQAIFFNVTSLSLFYHKNLLNDMSKTTTGRNIIRKNITPSQLISLLKFKMNYWDVTKSKKIKNLNNIIKIISEDKKYLNVKDEEDVHIVEHIYNHSPRLLTVKKISDISTEIFFEKGKNGKLIDMLTKEQHAFVSKLNIKENISTNNKKGIKKKM